MLDFTAPDSRMESGDAMILLLSVAIVEILWKKNAPYRVAVVLFGRTNTKRLSYESVRMQSARWKFAQP